MTRHKSNVFLKSAAIFALLPSAALADLSALEVWDSWKSLTEALGQTITVESQETNGDALILNKVQMSVDFPEGRATSTLEFLEFRERSDGTVAVTMAADLPFSVTVDPAEGEALDLAMILRQTGTSIIASGEPDDISFDFLAAEISVDVDKLVVDGVDADVDVRVTMTDIDGKYALVTGAIKSYTSDFSAGELSYAVAFSDPDTGGRFAMAGTIQDFLSSSNMEIPADLDLGDPVALFSGGFLVEGGLSAGQTTTSVQADDRKGNFSLTSTGASSALDFAIGNGSIQYGGSAQQVEYTVQSPQIPFPEVTLGFAEIAFNLLMPLAQSDDPQDFGFLVRFAGMEISDMIWGMFDPGGLIPRDPATVSLDLSGQMNWLVDIMDPATATDFEGVTPAELHSLTINDLTFSAVGAEITGTGDFTFDNSDLVTFDGLPAPTGAASLNIVGLNGLMDTLIQMGFLPQEQAMGARMMLGLFARPGNGEDTLTSTIEINADGSIFANGQQIK